MKLSRLVYEVVTSGIQLPIQTNYDSFIQGEYREDNDFAMQQANALSCINLAMSRLFEYDKTLHYVKECVVNKGVSNIDGLGDVVNVQYNKKNIKWSLVGGKDIMTEIPDGRKIMVEYRAEIPYFTEEDVITQKVMPDGSVKIIGTDKELENYGITNRMIPYIVEFAKSQLMETIAPEMAVNHNNRAEQYFNSMPRALQMLAQDKVYTEVDKYA